jgi:histidinol-phosphate phosphatase family protein
LSDIDAIVVGAGVVGLAAGLAIARAGHSVIVLEKNARIAEETSARNSGVIHAGLYYPTGSLKHVACVHGLRRLYPYLASRNVAHVKCGKLVFAATAAEAPALEALYALARANGVAGLAMLSGDEARAREPQLCGYAALLSGETGVLDQAGYALALEGDIEAAGGVVARTTSFVAAEPIADGFAVTTGGDEAATLACRWLVNAAGLHAARVARAIGRLDARTIPEIFYAKGSYFTAPGAAPFSHLIYPLPGSHGLGVHYTRDFGGGMRFGPDVEWLANADPARLDCSVDPARAAMFAAGVKQFWPALRDGALTPDYAGVRPKLGGPHAPQQDFRVDGPEVHGLAGLVNLFGIDSPGLTSSLALGEAALARLEGVDPARALKPAVFFDRDGTLNEEIGYAHREEDMRLVAGAAAAVRRVNERGWLAIVVTNQAGIARGLYDEAQMQRFHGRMQAQLAAHGARIDAFYHCPYHAEGADARWRHPDHPDRKPNPGMILRALRDLPVDPLRALLIGDNDTDIAAAEAAGIAGAKFAGGDLDAALTAALAKTTWR